MSRGDEHRSSCPSHAACAASTLWAAPGHSGATPRGVQVTPFVQHTIPMSFDTALRLLSLVSPKKRQSHDDSIECLLVSRLTAQGSTTSRKLGKGGKSQPPGLADNLHSMYTAARLDKGLVCVALLEHIQDAALTEQVCWWCGKNNLTMFTRNFSHCLP